MEYGDFHLLDETAKRFLADFTSPINSQLKEIYDEFWEKYIQKSQQLRDNNALPYFYAASKKYERADIKIMLMGKESDDWGHGSNEFADCEPNVIDLMHVYDFWINGNGGTLKDNGQYGPFMNFYAMWIKFFFENDIVNPQKLSEYISQTMKLKGVKKAFLESSYKWSNKIFKLLTSHHFTIGTIATNVVKVSHKGSGYDEMLNDGLYYITKKEVEILKPDISIATVYNKDKAYLSLLDDIFGTQTININMETDKEFRLISLPNNQYLILVRHPERMSYLLKCRLFNSINKQVFELLKIKLGFTEIKI